MSVGTETARLPAALQLTGERRSPRRARRFVADALDSIADEDVRDTAILLTCELVTNAVLHAGSPSELRVEVIDDRVRVTVIDGGDGMPAARAAGPLAEGGRGLELLDALAEEWRWEPRNSGKAVWFELSLGRDLAASQR